MFVTKKHLSRRTVLRGLGVSLSLPLLDAMIPARTALAQTAAAPKPKMGFFYFPHGAVQDRWVPKGTGQNFELQQILEPLKGFKDYMTVVTGLRNQAAEGAGVHAINPGTWLNCTSPFAPSDGTEFYGQSADQIAARHIGQDTPFPSLELCVETKPASDAKCNPTYGCGFGSTISFRSSKQPLPLEHNPRKLYYRLFGQGDTAAEREAIIEETGSLLDLVSDSAASVRGEARLQRSGTARRLPRVRARDRAPRAHHGRSGSLGARVARCAGRRAGRVRRPHQADARPHGARLPGGPHARRVVHDCGRDQHADLQPGRRVRCVPSAVAPSKQSGKDGASRDRAGVSLEGVRAVLGRASRTRRTATARCSITRSSCTAAT